MTEERLCQACRRSLRERGGSVARRGLCHSCSMALDVGDVRSLFVAILMIQRHRQTSPRDRALACARQVMALVTDFYAVVRGDEIDPGSYAVSRDDLRLIDSAMLDVLVSLAPGSGEPVGNLARALRDEQPSDWLALLDGVEEKGVHHDRN